MAGTSVLPIEGFGEGEGSIQLRRVMCLGTEDNLLQCPYEMSTSSCPHSQDAAVHCRGTAIGFHM